MAEAIISAHKCLYPGCTAKLSKVDTYMETKDIMVACTCENGHVSTYRYGLKESIAPAPKAAHKPVRTKVSGVTFRNSDGVDRQELLKRLTPGDSLEIVQGTMDGKTVLLVRHAIGVIGTVKRDTIRSLIPEAGPINLKGKVVQITGGQGEKTTYGCNIEVYTQDPSDCVFMDPDGRNIYHNNKNCCGMQNPAEVQRAYAVKTLHARPCKKCAAK